MPPQENTEGPNPNQARWERLLATCLDVTFGTLWWVREDLWKALQRDYDKNSNRMGHPGLSLRKTTPANFHEAIPVLHGRSRFGPVAIKNLTNYNPGEVAYFGHLMFPAEIPIREFASPAPNHDPNQLIGAPFERSRIYRNRFKPKIDEQERNIVLRWQKNIRHPQVGD